MPSTLYATIDVTAGPCASYNGKVVTLNYASGDTSCTYTGTLNAGDCGAPKCKCSDPDTSYLPSTITATVIEASGVFGGTDYACMGGKSVAMTKLTDTSWGGSLTGGDGCPLSFEVRAFCGPEPFALTCSCNGVGCAFDPGSSSCTCTSTCSGCGDSGEDVVLSVQFSASLGTNYNSTVAVSFSCSAFGGASITFTKCSSGSASFWGASCSSFAITDEPYEAPMHGTILGFPANGPQCIDQYDFATSTGTNCSMAVTVTA